MDNAGYTTLTRQTGLLREMQVVANNIANISTTGYRREGLIFSEHIAALDDGGDSVSMAHGDTWMTDTSQGPLELTGGRFDLAIEGEGYFMLETPQGQMLTRAGSFSPNAEGELVAPDGARLLDLGGAPVFAPADALAISVAADGTLSADGQPIAQIGMFLPTDPNDMKRAAGTRFAVPGGAEPVEEPRMLQGFLEGSNVSPVAEIARMIEVSRAYELGQTFLDREDERIRSVVRTFGR